MSATDSTTMPKGEPINLSTLVDVLPGAVVSRTLLKRQTGNITVFSFDQGQGLSEHTAPFDAFVYLLAGTAELTIGGRPITARAGEAVVMPAGIPHAVRAAEPVRMLLVMIRDAD